MALLSCACGFGMSLVTADEPLALAGPPAAFADGNGGSDGTPQTLLGASH